MTRLRGLAALLALVAVLVGIPWLLVRFGDWPITGIPTGDQLRNTLDTAVTDSTVFAVLTVAAWAVWAVFAVSVLVELNAAARGIQAPRITFAGPLQRSARVLVAAIVLAATIHHSTPTASATGLPHLARPAATVVIEAAVVYDTGVLPRPTRQDDPVTDATASASTEADQVATVTVARSDSAWSIAQTHLGDGMRWRDLWDLNHDRPQPDGRAWTDPQVIRVGWILQLPTSGDAPDAPPTLAPATAPTSDTPAVDQTPTSTVIVERGDTLTEIAAQHLGDPARYREIFELNRDIEQPDGRRLTDPNLIVPGWHLTLPAFPAPVTPTPAPTDEEPPVVGEPVTPTPPSTEPPTTAPTSNPPTTSPLPAAPAPSPASTWPPPTDDPAPQDSTSPPTSVIQPVASEDTEDSRTWSAIAPFLAGVSGAVVLASGLLIRFRRGRRRQAIRGALARRRPATPLIAVTEVAVVAAADVPLVRWAGQVLAELVARLDARRVTSVPVAVELSAEAGIEILWDAPFPNAPLPWTSSNAGWAWGLGYDPDSPVPADALPAPLPALVTVGEREGRQLLINLEAFGSVAVTGDPDRVAGFLRALALELGTGDDLADAYVVTVDLDVPVATERLRADTLRTAIDRIGSFERSIQAALETEHLPTTFAYRCGTPNGHLEATVIVAAIDSDDAGVAELLAVAPPHRSVAVLIMGPAATAGAQVHIDEDGAARIDPLGLTFTAANLPVSTVEEVGALLGDAEPLPDLADTPIQLFDPDEPAATVTAAATASPELNETTPDEGPDADSDPVRSPLDASIIVRVLGTPRVPDRPNLKRREVALTVFLACRGGQVNASAVQDALWNGQAVQGKTVWNLVGRTRTALGQLPDGTWVLPPSDRNRRMKGIGDSVTTDLAILRHLCGQAHTVSSSGAIGVLRQGLAFVEGPPFDADGYDWAHHGTQDVAEACELIERAVEQLVTLALDVDDTETARWAITQGLRGLPGDEVLYRLRMQVEHHTGNLPGVTAAYDELVRYLLELDADPSPSTVELHRQLVRRSRA